MQSKLSENFGKSLPYLELFWGPEGGGRNFTGGAAPGPPWNRPCLSSTLLYLTIIMYCQLSKANDTNEGLELTVSP